MIKISSNAKALAKAVSGIPDDVTKSLSAELDAFMEKFKLRFLQTRLTGRPGLNRGTGAVARSFKVTKSGRGTTVQANLDSDSEVAAIHEHGGTIRGSPYLAIPLTDQYMNIRQVTDGFFFVSKKGNLLFGRDNGTGLTPLFVLKESVDIPARLGLRRMFDNEDKNSVQFIDEVIEKVIAKAVRNV